MSSKKKTLIIIRHAKSDWSVGVDDFNRPLNVRGRGDSPRMGKFLNKQRLKPDFMLTSSANRARQTALLIAHELEFSFDDLKEDNALYHASPKTILAAIHELPNEAQMVYVFGHNPGLSELVSLLTGENCYLKTCCVAVLATEAETWEEIFWNSCTINDYFSPREI
jgi:phosphohistidine phosphatase